MKKAKFIINPSSGRQNFLKNIEGMIGKLIMDQIVNHVDVFYTEKQDDAKNEAMSMKKGEYDFVVAIGGDGTLNEVVNGVALGKNETPIAVISAGTVNDFANYLSLPQGIDEFCDLIRDFNIKEVDLGRIDGTYFMNVLAGGLLSDVGYKVPKELKAIFGKMAYYVECAKDIPKNLFHSIPISVKTEEFSKECECLLFIVANSQSVGGFRNAAPLASVSDGLLDVLILKKVEVAQLSNLLLKIVQGDHINHPNVEYFQTKKIDIDILDDSKVVVDYDGECFGELPVTIEVVPKAVKIIVPKSEE
ncbi:MAG: diacylglycerol kinase family lipid kinase [Lachnospiraceae bacterium]|nr:diacylglycerol kinase family lipid kinase [Lachnospiraceae bacterium]